MKIVNQATSFVAKLKRRFFTPKVMRKLVVTGKSQPRLRYFQGEVDHKPVVFRLGASSGLEQAEPGLINLLSKEFSEIITGRKILIKYNLNTANPYPASVCPGMLRTLTDLLLKLGASEVIAGDCCTIRLLPTRSQVKKAGLAEALDDRAKLICFDDLPWVSVPIKGKYLQKVTVPKAALEADVIIALANLKTHCHAVYTGALKLSVGFMHPLERIPLHRDHLQEKIAEINLAIQPDLFIIDARTTMVTGGPDHGKTEPGGCLLVSNNPLALDIEAYKLLYMLKAENRCLEGYEEDPFTLTQFKHARELGIGGLPWQGYQVVEWPPQAVPPDGGV